MPLLVRVKLAVLKWYRKFRPSPIVYSSSEKALFLVDKLLVDYISFGNELANAEDWKVISAEAKDFHWAQIHQYYNNVLFQMQSLLDEVDTFRQAVTQAKLTPIKLLDPSKIKGIIND